MKKVRVLIVEDSAFMRRILSDIIQQHSDLELVDTARDGLDGLEKIKKIKPDVVTMDIDMPRLDGLETLSRVMKESPLPVIMISTHTKVGSESTLKALDAGAVDFIAKPSIGAPEESLEELKNSLPQKIIAAASAKVALMPQEKPIPFKAVEKKEVFKGRLETAKIIVAVGASTGGPKALEAVFSALPANLPAAVLLSQHMPPGFTLSFSQRLDLLSSLGVKEAVEGDALLTGQALVAPGGFHMVVKNGLVHLDSGPKVNYVKPSIDVMLESLVECSQKILVVIMTGMGKDGAAGAAFLKKNKKDTILLAQDPKTALIPSMPDALIKSAPCDFQAPLTRLASEIDRCVKIFTG